MRLDFSVFDAVVDVREDPVLDVAMHLGSAMDKGHLRSMAP